MAQTPTVKDIMIRDVVTIDAAATVLDAARSMRDANVGMLPVVENGTVRGVVTDRDVVVRGVVRDECASDIPITECLSAPPRCAEERWTLDEAMEEMAAQQVGRLPVVDDAGHVIGIVTLSSLALRARRGDQTLETAQEVSRRSARAA
jgi:CBS domain-containing protein